MNDEIKYMAANATSEEVEAVYLHYDKLRLNERNLKAEIEQLQKELDEAIEIIEFSGVDYDEVLEAIRNDQ